MVEHPIEGYASWAALKARIREVARVVPFSGCGICLRYESIPAGDDSSRRVRAEHPTVILRSVDNTSFYCDEFLGADIVKYTFTGQEGDQDRMKRENAQLDHGVGRVFLYRRRYAPSRWIYMGEYTRGSTEGRDWIDVMGAMRRVYVITLARIH
jgi:hypothetical protein